MFPGIIEIYYTLIVEIRLYFGIIKPFFA